MKNLIVRITKIFFFLAVCFIGGFAQNTKETRENNSPEIPSNINLSSDKVIVPMDIAQRNPIVEVKINGKGPYKFFLDTGAGGTVLNQDLADELKLPFKGTLKIGDPADPEGITANRNLVEKLEVGGAVFSNFMAVSFDRAQLRPSVDAPRGVLGMPLFTKLLLTVDYPQHQVIIARGALPKSNGADIINYQISEAGLFGVPLKIAGQDFVATLDTGAQGGLGFPNSYMEKLPLNAKPVEIGRGRTVGGEAIIYGAKLNGDVNLGQYKFENINVEFFGRLTHLNLGYRFLNQFAITIDQQNRRMKFEKTTPAAEIAKPSADNSSLNKDGKFAEYAGLFGERRLTFEDENLYLQRISGPRGAGPKIKLKEISKDAFALDGTSDVKVKFVRTQNGEISEVQVLTPDGNWETSKRQ